MFKLKIECHINHINISKGTIVQLDQMLQTFTIIKFIILSNCPVLNWFEKQVFELTQG